MDDIKTSSTAAVQGGGRRLLILGGSGFLSGTLYRLAAEAGFEVWGVSRGRRPLPAGARFLCVDRDEPSAFAREIERAGEKWDAVVDCLGRTTGHGKQDALLFAGRTRHLLLVSSDAVYDPARRTYPQAVEPADYAATGYGRRKLECENALRRFAGDALPWTIVRPPHIYGPGAPLGCLPPAFRDPRLPARIAAGETIPLAGGGWFLHQPIYVDDLARLLLSLLNRNEACGRIFNTPGAGISTMRRYYEAVAEACDRELKWEEVPVRRCLEENPEAAAALCHRLYDLAPLAALGVSLPSTSLEEGMRKTVRAWRAENTRTAMSAHESESASVAASPLS